MNSDMVQSVRTLSHVFVREGIPAALLFHEWNMMLEELQQICSARGMTPVGLPELYVIPAFGDTLRFKIVWCTQPQQGRTHTWGRYHTLAYEPSYSNILRTNELALNLRTAEL